MKITEEQVRIATSFGLWGVSGGILLALFLTMAGSDPWARLLAAGWSVLLMAGMVLTWRLPDWRRFLALGLEVVVLVGGVGMAKERIQASVESTAAAKLAGVRAGADYQGTENALERSRALQDALTARLGRLPPDFTTATRELQNALREAQEQDRHLSAHLVDLERVTGTSTAPGLFDLFGPENAPMFETVMVILLALGTEGLALVLSGRATAAPPAVTSATPTAQLTPQVNASDGPNVATAAADRPHEVTADEYLATAKRLKALGLPSGYRAVRDELRVSDYRAKALIRQLVSEGRVSLNGKAGKADKVT